MISSHTPRKELIRALVSEIYSFRTAIEGIKEAQRKNDKQQIAELELKRDNSYEKIRSLIGNGSEVSLSKDCVKKINLEIVELVGKNKSPKEIVQIIEEKYNK